MTEFDADVVDALGEQAEASSYISRAIGNLGGGAEPFISGIKRTEAPCRSTVTDREHLNRGGADGR